MKATTVVTTFALGMAMLTGCATPVDRADGLVIVASTPIVADLVRQVAPQAEVHTLIPMSADPHSYEPSMAALRDVSHADLAFSNQLMLEERSLIATIDANLPEGAPHIALGEEAIRAGAYHIPLVEDAALATVWLGFRVAGNASDSTVTITATDIRGPGQASAFTTGTFGEPTAWITNHDGIDAEDSLDLPTNAHTHMSWGFSAPGFYEIDLAAELKSPAGSHDLGQTTVTFAVGVDPYQLGTAVVDTGHVDINADPAGGMNLVGDVPGGATAAESVVVAVPHSTTTVVPDARWKFLASPGAEAWILAQAVIGRHVHGEVDPHLWHDVENVVAYVDVIAEEIAALDPGNEEYFENAAKYTEKLKDLDRWAEEVIGSIPRERRTLVTAHDSFGYLARAYDLDIAGYVAPTPSLEPSVQQLANLTRTLQATPAAAVFLDPTSVGHRGELLSVAHATDKAVCTIYSDTLTPEIPSYTAMVEHNVRSLKACLDPESLPAWDPHAQIPVIGAIQ